jgi:hypothetical protein
MLQHKRNTSGISTGQCFDASSVQGSIKGAPSSNSLVIKNISSTVGVDPWDEGEKIVTKKFKNAKGSVAAKKINGRKSIVTTSESGTIPNGVVVTNETSVIMS